MHQFIFLYVCFKHCNFIGKTEIFDDQLRSLLAQFHYTKEIKEFEAKGVPFQTYLYVPETHPVTNDIFFEREDEAHLLKVRIYCSGSESTYAIL